MSEADPKKTPETYSEQPISSQIPLPAERDEDAAQPMIHGGFLHPGFWMACLWCIALVLFTQVPAGILAAAILIVDMVVRGAEGGVDAMFDSPTFKIAMGLSIVVAHGLIITISLITLRLVIGRDWKQQIALRRPFWWHLLLVLLLTPALIALAQTSASLLMRWFEVPSFMGEKMEIGKILAYISAIIAGLAAGGILHLLLWLIGGDNWLGPKSGVDPVAGTKYPVARQWILSLLMLSLFFVAANTTYELLAPGLKARFPAGPNSSMTGFEKMLDGVPILLAALVIGVLPGIGEELWCRAFIGRGLVGFYGYFWGVVLASLLFGAIHMDPAQGTMAMIVGLLLHYVYLVTRSLLMPMLLHFLNNFLAVLLSQWSVLKNWQQDGNLPIFVLAGSGVLLFGICFVLWMTRVRVVDRGEGTWSEPFPGVVCPPAGSGAELTFAKPSAVEIVILVFSVVSFAVGFGVQVWLTIQ
jgi:membrane protease YdiL (CAAX protease family)